MVVPRFCLHLYFCHFRASLVAQMVKQLPAMRETGVRFLAQEDPLEKGKATRSSVLAWRIPWTVYIVHGVPESQTQLSDFHFHVYIHGGSDGKESVSSAGDPGSISGWGRSPRGGNVNPLQYSCLEDPMDRGAWWAAVYGVTESRTQLK